MELLGVDITLTLELLRPSSSCPDDTCRAPGDGGWVRDWLGLCKFNSHCYLLERSEACNWQSQLQGGSCGLIRLNYSDIWHPEVSSARVWLCIHPASSTLTKREFCLRGKSHSSSWENYDIFSVYRGFLPMQHTSSLSHGLPYGGVCCTIAGNVKF